MRDLLKQYRKALENELKNLISTNKLFFKILRKRNRKSVETEIRKIIFEYT